MLTMSEMTIEAENLGKMYRLYKHPRDRVLDAFGLNFWRKEYFQEFWAIRNLDLKVRKGERLGIIGKNGAGKSTLLKIIVGNVSATEGKLTVNGRIQALMELGTGFHPEFTGRQNISAALSYQGFSQHQIASIEEEIIDFAELDEFIDQPLKTYSAGMYARLAFSTATTVEPDLLVIDEVLGAGDAYFASKCFDRMKRLTQDSGATVLFVSHDMSSVEMLCSKCLWIDRGRKRMEGPVLEVTKTYAQEVRERTAQRVKAKNALMSTEASLSMRKLRENPLQLILCFVRVDGSPIQVSAVRLYADGLEPIEIKVGAPQDNSTQYDGFVLIDNIFSVWDRPVEDTTGHHFRAITTLADRRSAVVFNFDGLSPSTNLQLCVKFRGVRGATARLEVYDGSKFHLIADIGRPVTRIEAENDWVKWTGTIRADIVENLMEVSGFIKFPTSLAVHPQEHNAQTLTHMQHLPEFEREGNHPDTISIPEASNGVANPYHSGEIFQGKVAVEKVLFTNARGEETPIVQTFDDLYVHIDYHVLKGPVALEFVVCLHRLGIIASQSLSGLQEHGIVDGQEGWTGRCTLEIPRLPLGKGNYFVSIGIFPPLQYNSLDTEKLAYVLHDRRYELHVEEPENIVIDLGMCRARVRWKFSQR